MTERVIVTLDRFVFTRGVIRKGLLTEYVNMTVDTELLRPVTAKWALNCKIVKLIIYIFYHFVFQDVEL